MIILHYVKWKGIIQKWQRIKCRSTQADLKSTGMILYAMIHEQKSAKWRNAITPGIKFFLFSFHWNRKVTFEHIYSRQQDFAHPLAQTCGLTNEFSKKISWQRSALLCWASLKEHFTNTTTCKKTEQINQEDFSPILLIIL